ncbi:MAG: carboxypeptidase regulatory-like domain-containing protein [Pyrinomonadaceae bacterium]
MRLIWGISFIAICFGLMSQVAAQDYRGKVQGTVTDEAGAAIPGTNVVLHNNETGVEVTRQTSEDGHYIFDFVDPGNYTVIVEQTGFKKAEQKNVTVQQRGDVTVDIKLAVGQVSEVVTVEAPPVEVQFNTSSQALTLENKVIDQLPIRGRNPYNIATLDPTVSPGTGSTSNENRPYHHAYANDIDAGGGTQRANDVLLDGVPLTSSYKTSYTPAIDAVQEVTFQKNAVDSEYGYSSGGIIVLNMKAGTNDYHGTAIANGRSPRFNAFNDPTLKRTAGADEKNFRGTNLKIFGGTFGGHLITNKLFFFTSYEHWKDASPLSFTLTVPTALERAGDFSQTVIGGVQRTIYDPLTSTGSSGTRTAFLNNVIPAGRFDPTALKLLAALPMPNLPGNQDNLQGFKVNNTTYWNFSERVDWNYSERMKTFFRFGRFKAHLLENNPTGAALLPVNGSNRYGLSIAADTVYTISPKWILNVRANYHRLTDEYAADTALLGKDGLAQLFPNFYSSLYTIDQVFYPAFDFGSNSFGSSSNIRLGRPGREFSQHPQGFGGSARLNTYIANHSIKFGGELRFDKGKGARFEPLNFIFRQQLTANANSNPNLNNSGSPFATFLLGYIDNNSFASRVPLQEVVSPGYAAYFMDDYKVNNRLTLNLGLRWEYEPGPVDAQNRLSQRLDLTQPIPEFQTTPPVFSTAALQAKTLLASKGEQHIYNGAWIFATADNRSVFQKKKLNLLPRVGGAFKLDDKSVFRFGYARYQTPSSKIRDPLGDFVNQYSGFATTTTAAPTINNGRPQVRISDPFPASLTPIQQPLGQSLGRYTNLGNSIGAAGNATNGLDQYLQRPQVNDRISITYQRGIWGHFVLDVDYFINKGHHVPYAVDLNMADPAFSYEVARSVFNQSVPNPFFNYLTPDKFPGTLRTQSTITVGALLRPYPQYGVINQTNTNGKQERLQSFEIQLQRPFAKGLSVLVAYAYQHEQSQEFFDDFATFARRFEWRDTDTPRKRLTSAVSWDIPVGRGGWLLKDAPRAVDLALGGWQFTTTTRIYSGRPLFFTQNLIVDGNPKISNPTNDRYFDTSKFHALPTSTLATDPVNLHRRDNPVTYPGLVGPGVWQTDMTISKAFRLGERFKLETRLETYNAFNHVNLDNPTVDFTSGNFGKITRKLVAYNGREVQYGLRLVF